MRSRFSIKEVSPLLFAVLIDILGFGLVYPVLTALFTSDSAILSHVKSEHLRFFYLSIGFILYPFFMFFGSSLMGDLSDKWGRKRVILLCMGGLSIAFALMACGVFLSSLFLLFLGRAFSGLMSASMSVVLAAISDLSTEANKAVHMSYVALIQSFGFVLGPLMGGVLSDHTLLPFFNFSLPFIVSALLSLVAFVWIKFSYQESCSHRISQSHFDLLRVFKVFSRALHHKKIKRLALVFFLMQSGISLFLQFILIDLQEQFDYSSSQMGLFNAYLGFWYAVGLLTIIPYAAKRFKIERIALWCLVSTSLCQGIIAFISYQGLLWLIALPLSLSVQVAFSAMLTSISNAADKNEQGWAMGITGSIISLSFILTGLCGILVPILGVQPLILIGALLLGGSALIMNLYCKRDLN